VQLITICAVVNRNVKYAVAALPIDRMPGFVQL